MIPLGVVVLYSIFLKGAVAIAAFGELLARKWPAHYVYLNERYEII
jgi:hypothetical protein